MGLRKMVTMNIQEIQILYNFESCLLTRKGVKCGYKIFGE